MRVKFSVVWMSVAALMLVAIPVSGQEEALVEPENAPAEASAQSESSGSEEDAAADPSEAVETQEAKVVLEEKAPATEAAESASTPVAEETSPSMMGAFVPVDRGGSPVGVAWNDQVGDQMAEAVSEESAEESYLWDLQVGGYLRVGYRRVEDDENNAYFGRNDGFVLGNARLSVSGSMLDSLGFRLQLDGAVDRKIASNRPDGEVVTRLKDAVIAWQPLSFLRLDVGQFKPPFDVEEQGSTVDMLAVERSVGSRGVHDVEGYDVAGLSVSREVGVQLESSFFPMSSDDDVPEGFGTTLALAVTNGNSANRALNDNDKLAFYGRAELHWSDMVTLGGAYFRNDRSVGVQPPEQIQQQVTGWTADATIDVAGATLIAGINNRTTAQSELPQEPEWSAAAYHVQVAYQEPFWGFQPTYRWAFFDPTATYEASGDDPLFESDALTHHTIGLNYNPAYPVRLMLQYTLAMEEEGRELDNDRLDVLLQTEW